MNSNNIKKLSFSNFYLFNVSELKEMRANINRVIQMREKAESRASTPRVNTNTTPPVVGGKRVVKKKRIIKK